MIWNKCTIGKWWAVAVFGVAGIVVWTALVHVRPARAQAEKAGLLSEPAIRDAILGRRELTDGERQLLDLNEDGLLDASDLIAFLKGFQEEPGAAFASSVSVTTEGVGSAQVTVEFARAFSGTLHYSVGAGSTATPGIDFIIPSETVLVNGASVQIPIEISDDLEIEAMETIELVLEEGEGYVIGAPSAHTIHIDENDAVWHGMVNHGRSIQGFALRVQSGGDTVQAALLGDDTGMIPQSDPPEAGWPVQSLNVTETSLEMHVAGIIVPAEHTTRLGGTFTRSFDFVATLTSEAAAVAEGTLFNSLTEIAGDVTERLVPDSPTWQHLARSRRSVFTLLRARPSSAVGEPVLVPVE